MELPAGVNPINVSDGNRRRYVLKLNKSLYGLKQAGYNWFEKLREGLITRDFIQSEVNKCVFFRKDCIVLTYVDDCIILGKDMAILDAVISSLKEGHEDFELVDQCNIGKYLGLGLLIRDIDVNIFKMSQSFLSLDKKIRQREETLMLGSLCLIVTWTVYLGNTHGYILEGLECSGILLTVFDLRFKWQCIKPLVSRFSQ
jgi:hypothetical protein